MIRPDAPAFALAQASGLVAALREAGFRGDAPPPDQAGQGAVALLTQDVPSGLALLHAARRRRLGFSAVVATGLAGGIGAPAALRLLLADAATKVVALSLEAPPEGEALLAALDEARRLGKPVVILHTGIDGMCGGGLAPSPHHIRQSLFEAHGALCADSAGDLIDIAFFLAGIGARLPLGGRVAILTGGGGGGVITADLCGHAGLEVPPLSAETRRELAGLVPPIASTANPIDLTPEMFNEKNYDRFPRVLDVVAADPGIDAIFLPTTFNAPRGNTVAAEVLAAFTARSPKPVLIAAAPAREMQDVLIPAGIHAIGDAAQAARALRRILRHAQAPAAPCRAGTARPWPPEGLPGVLAQSGIAEAPRWAFGVDDPAPDLAFPCVLEAVPAVGSPIGDLCDAAELMAARGRLLARGAPISAFETREDVQGRLTLCLVGFVDASFGPMLGCATGGVQGRMLDDLALLRAPSEASAVAAALEGLHAIRHARKMRRLDSLNGIASAIAALSGFIAAVPPGHFLRLDPVDIAPGGLCALDAAIIPFACQT